MNLRTLVSKTWTPIGSRAVLAKTIESITQIPASVLTLERSLADVSIAKRMLWAANRETSRVEDMTYSLMGLFGVSMPTMERER